MDRRGFLKRLGALFGAAAAGAALPKAAQALADDYGFGKGDWTVEFWARPSPSKIGQFNGYLDEIRITKGVARYAGTIEEHLQQGWAVFHVHKLDGKVHRYVNGLEVPDQMMLPFNVEVQELNNEPCNIRIDHQPGNGFEAGEPLPLIEMTKGKDGWSTTIK